MRISDWSSDVCSSDLVGKQADARLRGPSVSGRPAIEEEAQAPGGHSWKRLGAEQKRRLLAAEPAQHGEWRRRRVPRVAEAEGDQAAVRPRGAQPRIRLALENRDRKSTRLNSSHYCASRMPSSAGKKKP